MPRKLMKIVTALLVSSLFTMQVFAAANEVGEQLIRRGFGALDGQVAKLFGGTAKDQLIEGLENAMKAVSRNGQLPRTTQQLDEVFSNTGAARAILSKPVDQLTNDDIITLTRNINVKAAKGEWSNFMPSKSFVCDELSESIPALMIRVTSKTRSLLAKAPSGIADVASEATTAAGSIGVKNARELVGQMSDTQKRIFWVHVMKAKEGTPEEVALARQVIELYDGVLEPKSMLVTLGDEVDPQFKKNLTTYIADSIRNKGKKSARQAFKDTLEREANSNPRLKEALDNLKAKNCWGLW